MITTTARIDIQTERRMFVWKGLGVDLPAH